MSVPPELGSGNLGSSMRFNDRLIYANFRVRKPGLCANGYLAVALLAIAIVAGGPVYAASAAEGYLDVVRARGHVNCGVRDGATGFSSADSQGQWSGLDVDFCAALATAVFGRKSAVKFIPVKNVNDFQALRSGDVDVLPRSTSWTLTRDTELGVRFVGVLFYDGQGFLARRNHVISSVFALSGASLCVVVGTQSARAVRDFFDARKMRYQLVTSESWDDLVEIYGKGGCTVLAGDVSVLARARMKLAQPANHVVLPEMITKEPLGPVVRSGDEQWFSVVRWTLMALIAAEELGAKSDNIADLRQSSILAVRRFVGVEANLGASMGLAQDWTYQVIRQVGNYGEIFDRNLGENTAMGLHRGLNKLWNQGGLHYAAPFR